MLPCLLCLYHGLPLFLPIDQDVFINNYNRCGIDPVNGFLYNNGSEYEFCETETELVKYVNEHFGKDYDIDDIDEDDYSAVQKLQKKD
jgi:hypothetical protein